MSARRRPSPGPLPDRLGRGGAEPRRTRGGCRGLGLAGVPVTPGARSRDRDHPLRESTCTRDETICREGAWSPSGPRWYRKQPTTADNHRHLNRASHLRKDKKVQVARLSSTRLRA